MNIQWQKYRELELIADSIAEPQTDKLAFVARLSQVWGSLANRSTQKLCCEQQVEHLKRCLAIDWLDDGTSEPSIWRTVWAFLSQPVFEWSLSTSSEPQIRQVSDRGGRTWWYAYDPITGQTTYLESEEDVQIWLEERF